MILGELGHRNGVVVLSSSRWDEDSYEAHDWSNGAFKAALTSKVADTNTDGAVTIDELVRHVTHGVAARTDGLQHPVLGQDNPESGIRLPIPK